MDECPFCGEPIDEDATFCRHCGSDDETGWNPDSDYLSLELPEEEEDPDLDDLRRGDAQSTEDRAAHLQKLIGPALVVGAWLTFVIYGQSIMEPHILVLIAVYLAATIILLSRLAVRPRSRSIR